MGSSQLDPPDLHRSHRSRTGSGRAPSSKISTARASSSRCPSHAVCSQEMAPAPSKPAFRPLIFRAVDPHIMKVEPAEFRQVVQKFTGSRDTRRLLRSLIRRSEEMKQKSSAGIPEMKLQQQGATNSLQDSHYDELQTGTTFWGVSADPFANDQFPPSSSFNPALIDVISHNSAHLVQGGVSPLSPARTDASSSTLSYSLGSPRSSAGTNQQISKLNHPASSAASDSAMPPNYEGLNPSSPNSSPSVTSISEIEQAGWGAFFSEQAGGGCFFSEQDNTTYEDHGSGDFFKYSADSYYGSCDA